MNNKHNITINIGPQSSEAWLYISIASAAIAFFVFAVPALVKKETDVELAKIQGAAKK